MTYYDQENQFLRQRLQKEIPILTALIQNLYQELDRKFHLNGAKIPVTFGFETDSLGSYTRQSAHEKEHFHFSLLFVAYGVNNPLSKEDRIDLFKHEYAQLDHNYDKVLKSRIHDKTVPIRDTYQRQQKAQKQKDEVVQYKIGDNVTHPKFGDGIVEKINLRSGGVHLHIRFDGEVKCIDQKWLMRRKYT